MRHALRHHGMGLLQSTTRPKSYREALLDKKRPSPFVLLDPKQKRVAQFAFDVGGTLAKLVYVTTALTGDPVSSGKEKAHSSSVLLRPSVGESEDSEISKKRRGSFERAPDININEVSGDNVSGSADVPVQGTVLSTTESQFSTVYELHFRRFSSFEDMVSFLKSESILNSFLLSDASERCCYATGGGAYKYSEIFASEFKTKIIQQEEMRMLIYGVNFLLTHTELSEVFTYNMDTCRKEIVRIDKSESIYPYLIVNIGSGTSIVKVSGPDAFQRVSGSTIGGGTYLGLCRLLTNLNSFDEIRDVEKEGRTSAVDLLVSDIYGDDKCAFEELGLKGDVIASSFGKVSRKPGKGDAEVAPEDITKSLLVMICNTICQIAYLNAKIEGVNAIYFAGGFLREKQYVWSKLEYAMRFWSKGSIKARFLVHDGYLGALGALMCAAKETSFNTSNIRATMDPSSEKGETPRKAMFAEREKA